MMIDSSPPHGFSPYGHGTFVPVQTTYKPSAVFWYLKGRGRIASGGESGKIFTSVRF
jgi:hypothetical protein